MKALSAMMTGWEEEDPGGVTERTGDAMDAFW
jgi:hypothetical protein